MQNKRIILGENKRENRAERVIQEKKKRREERKRKLKRKER